MEILFDALLDAILDALKLLPFLFLTYLLMEWLENKTSDHTKQMLKRSGRLGPLVGGALGVVPQCGFSAAASNLYAGRVITLGTLLAVYLSTSDEMLPIFLSERDRISGGTVVRILLIKMVIGIVAGLLVDLVYARRDLWTKIRRKGDSRKNNPFEIKELCQQEHCGCSGENSTLKEMLLSALKHTLQVWAFLLLIGFALNILVELVGIERVAALALHGKAGGVFLAGIIGLIPNCGASVVLTQLYLEGAMSFGAMMGGLLVGAGVGLLVLFRVRRDLRKNLCVAGLLYLIGVLAGVLLEITGVGNLI
ncbi:MAG: arsenic efflux protein [Lachnospiraceae bacterium]|nr:arsenic efflux protein [Lachnospiraceae bacterium]